MKPFALSRRAVLRGAGATVALPLLEAMLNSSGTALAQGAALPKRFGIFFFGNGIIIPRWNPAATGGGWQLSEALAPLAPIKSYVNVATGFQVKTPDDRGHHNGCGGILSAAPVIAIAIDGVPYASKFGAPSIDQVAADLIGKGTPFPSLQLRISKAVVNGEGPTLAYMSHRGPEAPLPPEHSPAAVFTRLFGSFSVPPSDPTPRVRASVLDAVAADARRLSARLGASDRARLDQHLTGISELRQQILALPTSTNPGCTKPAAVSLTNSERGAQEQVAAVSRAMSDLLAMAWACDLSRVATVQFTGSVGYTLFSAIGLTRGSHDLSHDDTEGEARHQAVVFTMEQYSYLLQKLQATPDGAGNLLDSACVLATSDVSDGAAHLITEYPLVIGGRAGGALRYPGVHARSTSRENTSNVLLSCLQAVGTGLSSVGKDSGASSTPCAPLLA